MKRIINLPYELNALEPVISKETLDYHYNKHHKGYEEKLIKLVEGTPLENKSLEYLIKNETGEIYNNAAQVWNHNFYWNCLGSVKNFLNKDAHHKILDQFGSDKTFKEEFLEAGVKHFGSGYVWLVKDEGKLKIVHTANADCPLKKDQVPLLTLDLWEHAYYIDYRNDRKEYLSRVWNLINWEFVNSQI